MIHDPLILLTVGSTGSSALMGCLANLGMWLGRCDESNGKKFSENIGLRALNRLVLGGDCLINASDTGWPSVTRTINTTEGLSISRGGGIIKLRSIVHSRIKSDGYGGGAWGFKDPRSVLAFPMWWGMFPSARYLVLDRSTDEIAKGSQKMGERYIKCRRELLERAWDWLVWCDSKRMRVDYSGVGGLAWEIANFAGMEVDKSVAEESFKTWKVVGYG